MNPESSYAWRKQLIWGVVLVGAGVTIFLGQMDLIEVRGLWHYWPLLMVVGGINKMIGYPSAKHFSSGLWMVFLGLWLFAWFDGMLGLDSWPFLVIACGVSMIVEPLARQRSAPNEENRNEK